MNVRLHRSRGFTIVELLIVIVVIGILAAITVVAFNGVQARAEAARFASNINSYEKALRLYKSEKGVFPSVSAVGSECLGTTEDLPTTTVFARNQCGSSKYMDLRTDGLNTALSAYIANPPKMMRDKEYRESDGTYFRGVYYESDGNYYYIEYYVGPNETCPVGKEAWADSGLKLCYTIKYS